MRPLIVINIEHIEATPFVVAMFYDDKGQLQDSMIQAGGSVPAALRTIQALADANRVELPEIYTSNRSLYAETLSRPGILASIKHPSDTKVTRSHIEQNSEILREIYEIEPLEPRKKPPKWRARLYQVLIKITNYVKGEYDYAV